MRHVIWVSCCIAAIIIRLESVVILEPQHIRHADFPALSEKIKKIYPEPVVLNLSKQALVQIPVEFFIGLENIVELYLQENNLKELPPTILDLQRLQILDCSENQLTEVPEQIGQLAELRILNLSHNRLRGLPESFKHLTRLQVLGLAHNLFEEVPAFIPSLYALTLATLAHNNIKALTPIRILTRLRLLDVSFNNLFSISPDMLPTKLHVLLMNNNFIAELPGNIFALPELNVLDISRNKGIRLTSEKAPPTIPLLLVDGAEFGSLRLFTQ